MKQKLLLLAGLCAVTVSSFGTIHVITVGAGGGTSFSPASLTTVALGDTIKWEWATGGHTTTSTPSIPAGAIPWDKPITSVATSYMYKPAVVGTYNYVCTPHSAMMTGSFVVSTPTGVDQVKGSGSLFSMYPNPAQNNLHLTLKGTSPVSVALVDLNGRIIKKADYKNVTAVDISLGDIANGTYVVSVTQDGNTKKQQLVIAR